MVLLSVALFKILTTSLQKIIFHNCHSGTAVAQLLKCYATNRKVAGSIPADVSGFFIDSASNRNEYQEHFLGVKAAGA